MLEILDIPDQKSEQVCERAKRSVLSGRKEIMSSRISVGKTERMDRGGPRG
jgi:hypothetical protein